MKDKKGKKGMTLVIAVGKPSPKSPMDTAKPDMDEKKKSEDAFDMAWSLIKNYNMMGVPASQSMMTDLQAARQRVNELDAAAEMEQDPQRKLQLKMQAQQLYDQLTMMMSARR